MRFSFVLALWILLFAFEIRIDSGNEEQQQHDSLLAEDESRERQPLQELVPLGDGVEDEVTLHAQAAAGDNEENRPQQQEASQAAAGDDEENRPQEQEASQDEHSHRDNEQVKVGPSDDTTEVAAQRLLRPRVPPASLDDYRKRTLDDLQRGPHCGAVIAHADDGSGAPRIQHRLEPGGEEYNFAAASHGAKLVSANKESKGASNILNKDKEKYYRSPCSAEDKFVVIELSEEALVDMFVIANFEFYSSNLKEFELLGSLTYPAEEWRSLGKFEAENARHEHSFRLPKPEWVRYLKLQMISHYGNEFYCTLSMVEVFGIDAIECLMEEWLGRSPPEAVPAEGEAQNETQQAATSAFEGSKAADSRRSIDQASRLGDSVLKVLMQKVKALEFNQTLFEQYVEELDRNYKGLFSELDSDLISLKRALESIASSMSGLAAVLSTMKEEKEADRNRLQAELRDHIDVEAAYLESLRAQVQHLENKETVAVTLAFMLILVQRAEQAETRILLGRFSHRSCSLHLNNYLVKYRGLRPGLGLSWERMNILPSRFPRAAPPAFPCAASRRTHPAATAAMQIHTKRLGDNDHVSKAAQVLAVCLLAYASSRARKQALVHSGVCNLGFCSVSMTTEVTIRRQVKRLQEEGASAAEDGSKLAPWLEELKEEALRRGVSEDTVLEALREVHPSQRIMELDWNQPELKLTAESYLERMVDEFRIAKGVKAFLENRELLQEVSAQYGVPPTVLTSIWGIESNYGTFTGSWNVIQALVTLAYTSPQASRAAFFREELFHALFILDQGHGPADASSMKGSWAGAMGQCQFMPSSYRSYAVDHDKDGRSDIWTSKADVLASMANYLVKHGWQPSGHLAQRVLVPLTLDSSLYGLDVHKQVSEWINEHGVHPCGDLHLPEDEVVSLVAPDGPSGAAYLACNNFRVVMRYNTSALYCMSVYELAREIDARVAAASRHEAVQDTGDGNEADTISEAAVSEEGAV